MSSDRAAQLIEAGIWLKLSGDREGARKLFERALKLDPGNEKATQLLAGGPAPGEDVPPSAPRQPMAPAIPSAIGSHPFERPATDAGTDSAANWGLSGLRPSPEPNLEGDWGRLTGATTPVPQPRPELPVDPGPYTSSSSNVVLGASPVPQAPKSTLVYGPPTKAPGAKPTMQLFPEQESRPAPRTTLQLFGATEEPEAAPSMTPPLFGSSDAASGTPITFGGSSPTPPPSTPSLFASLKADAPAPRNTNAMGNAWAWTTSSPPPPVDETALAEPEPMPTPRPSPSLAPRAESAWDQRSNPGIKLEAVAGQDRALDLLSSDSKVIQSPDSRKAEIRTILRGARDLLDLDDHSGAMELIVKAQAISPDDPDALVLRERSERTLLNMFESKLGRLETIPRVLLKDDEIIWLNLDHRAGFVLAQIDGTVSFDDLFSVSGMSRIDTARILAQLVEEGVISRG